MVSFHVSLSSTFKRYIKLKLKAEYSLGELLFHKEKNISVPNLFCVRQC